MSGEALPLSIDELRRVREAIEDRVHSKAASHAWMDARLLATLAQRDAELAKAREAVEAAQRGMMWSLSSSRHDRTDFMEEAIVATLDEIERLAPFLKPRAEGK